MQQAIDIRISYDPRFPNPGYTNGQKIDVYQDETIEVNMGGISLLNLADRTASYTNSFKLPRTPNNEQIFGFSANPTNETRPVIHVRITKGLYTAKAILRIKEFNSDYKAEIVYASDGVLSTIKNLNFYTLHEESVLKQTLHLPELYAPNTQTDIFFLTAFQSIPTDYSFFAPVRNTHVVNLDSNIRGGAAMSFQSFINKLKYELGINITGTALTDPLVLKSCIFNPYGYFYIDMNYTYTDMPVPTWSYDIYSKRIATTEIFSCADVLKALSQIYLFDIQYNDNGIVLNSFTNSVNNTATQIETLSFTKTLYSGYSAINYVVYDIADKDVVSPYFGADQFVGDGDGSKEVLKISNTIPKFYSGTYGGYDCVKKEIMSTTSGEYLTKLSSSTNYRTTLGYEASPITMAGTYSTILDGVFTNPVILSADGYIDPLTADTIMRDRVINSVKLGGRYWVDEMKYNLTTGKAALKLIKL